MIISACLVLAKMTGSESFPKSLLIPYSLNLPTVEFRDQLIPSTVLMCRLDR